MRSTTLTLFLVVSGCTGDLIGGGGSGGGADGDTGGGSSGTGGGSATAGGSGTGGTGGTSSTDLPCEVATVLQGTCQSCHGVTLANSAPIRLVTRDDLLAPSAINSAQTVGERSVFRMRLAMGGMPPAPNAAIASDLVDAFDTWVQAGMPASACSPGGTGGGSSGAGGGSSGTGGGTGGSAGSGAGGGNLFTADTPEVYVAKVKNVLVGLPPTQAELDSVRADPTQLGPLVDSWMQLQQYQTKMLRFFQLGFQQTQITSGSFGNMLDLGQLQVSSNPMLQNLQESFARTMLDADTHGTPFTRSMTTQTYAMTPALQVFYALLDVWQVDNSATVLHDQFRTANPTLNITVSAASGPIPLSQSLDPTSANYMHWYDANLMAVCGHDPQVMPARSNAIYMMLLGKYVGCNGGGGTGVPQLTAADFNTWKMVTVRAPRAGEQPTRFFDLATFRNPAATELVLDRSWVGFFTPAFFANWDTNSSNQMRVTINQALIVATGTQIDGTDPTVPTSTPGLDTVHANDPQCVYCHRTLDPTRSILSATYSWNYGAQLTPALASQKGRFAYRGVEAPVNSMLDLGTTLSTHPLFATAWVQKLCYWVNSQACDATDPEFQRLVLLFQSSGYAWRPLVKALVTSPITTHASSTKTAVTGGVVTSVMRKDHLCAAWNARLGFKDICGLDLMQTSPLPGTAKPIIPGLPSDGYSRGGVIPVLHNDPSLFYRAGLENICAGLAQLTIDNNTPPSGTKQWSSTQPTAAIGEFVSLVAGLPASDPRAAALNTALTDHWNQARVMSGITPTYALRSTFMAACMSPSAVSVGL